MVQRIVANKFGVQSGVKGERRVASFKTSSSFCSSGSSAQNPDGKNRVVDLKKKMKKSRAIQLSDLDISLTSSPIRKNISLPGKPPPICSNVSEIKQKQNQNQNQPSMIRTSDGSPNYMKSTSCFDARKEVSQVSSRICSDIKKPRRRSLENSAHGSVTGLKPTRCLTKCSSEKLVRTLTKTPSFKKSSRVALCADMNSHRATCSSTLKDSKFPAYLMLSHGATESEGTSTMKVCPYTYCSLNGHRHAPVPPLKCFLSARRRLLKTQKNLKVEPSGCGVKRVDNAGGEVLDEDMIPEVLVNDGGLDFFIEIFSENKVEGAGSVNRVMNEDCAGVSCYDVRDEAELNGEGDSEPVVENISDGSMDSEVGLGEDSAGSVNLHSVMDGDCAGVSSYNVRDEAELNDEGDSKPVVESIYDGSMDSEVGLGEDGAGSVNLDSVMNGDCAGVSSCNVRDEAELNDEGDNKPVVENISDGSMDSEVTEGIFFHGDEYEDNTSSTDTDMEEWEEQQFLSMESDGLDELEDQSEETHLQNGELAGFGTEKQLPDNDLVLQEELLDADIDTDTDTNTDNQIDSQEKLDDSNHGDEAENSVQENSNQSLEAHLSDEQCQDISVTETSAVLEITGNEELSDLKMQETSSNDNSIVPVDIVEGKEAAKLSRTAVDSSQELDLWSKNWEVNPRSKRVGEESEDPRSFNPREPNYLPLVADPEAEKVDLKHQLIDDRKNAEEWMVDYALRRTVTKLAPAKKKKVALLVEAFESVMPTTSRYEFHVRNHASRAFTPAKRIQACF
ncbi:calmodulin binding protein PICBP-like isoform X1 [Cucurbita moschata]|uniref:Calmodulin binding protein PICBP-like isoform X1 n=1 Tax=Cucurbita moschata TaxID=3662 RepID=A0A6J1FFM6_CUCMO|nr:calmodulin binding protein PICBP-like isoform X1 [Cucurbita moschata]